MTNISTLLPQAPLSERVDYTHILAPRVRTARPDYAKLIHFSERLIEDRWIVPPQSESMRGIDWHRIGAGCWAQQTGCFAEVNGGAYRPAPVPLALDFLATFGHQDVHLQWPMGQAQEHGVRFPLIGVSDAVEQGDYIFCLHLDPAEDADYRFAVVIDSASSAFERSTIERVTAHPDLVALCEATLDMPFRQLRYIL